MIYYVTASNILRKLILIEYTQLQFSTIIRLKNHKN